MNTIANKMPERDEFRSPREKGGRSFIERRKNVEVMHMLMDQEIMEHERGRRCVGGVKRKKSKGKTKDINLGTPRRSHKPVPWWDKLLHRLLSLRQMLRVWVPPSGIVLMPILATLRS